MGIVLVSLLFTLSWFFLKFSFGVQQFLKTVPGKVLRQGLFFERYIRFNYTKTVSVIGLVLLIFKRFKSNFFCIIRELLSYVDMKQFLQIILDLCKILLLMLREFERINSLQPGVAFLYPFRGYRKATLGCNGLIKACVLDFFQIFIFSPNDSPSKTMKNVFYFI